MFSTREHSSSVVSPAGPSSLRGLASATFFGLILVGLLSGCGSGGSGSGGTTTSSPPTTVTQTVGSAGGMVSLPDGSTVTFDSGVLKDGSSVTVSSSPQPPNPFPEGAKLLSQSVTVQLSGGGLVDVPGQDASVRIDLPIVQSSLASRFLQLISPKAVFAQTVTANPYRFGIVTIRTGTGDPGRSLYGFDVPASPSSNLATRLIIPASDFKIGGVTTPAVTASYVDIQGCQPTTMQLYRVIDPASSEFVPPSNRIQVDSGKTPLILVHGIQFRVFCNRPYRDTWENVIGPLLSDESFKNQFQIYSVHYDTTKSIHDNGQALAERLNLAFDAATPVVVLAHSMGGLVTRAAMTPVPPRNFPPANIAGLVTLGTPHHGTPIASAEGFDAAQTSGYIKEFLLNHFLKTRADGYVDLASDQPGFHSLASGGEEGNPGLSALRQCERGELLGCESLAHQQRYARIVAIAGSLSDNIAPTYDALWSNLLCQRQYGENDIVVPASSALFLTESLLDRATFSGYAHTSFPSSFSTFCSLTTSSSPSAPRSITDFSQSNSDLAIKVKVALSQFLQSSPLPSTFTLTVTKLGTGTGTVTSNPVGINCGSTCTNSFASGATVVLTAAAGTGSTFTGWNGGGCSGTGTCTVTMTANQNVTATFAISPPPGGPFILTVAKAGMGSGTVTSNPTGIDCGATCAGSFSSGVAVTLTPTPTTGSAFAGWQWEPSSFFGGVACSLTAPAYPGDGRCTFTLDQNVTATARFEPGLTLTVTITGSGSGTVAGCTATCSYSVPVGAVIPLTAQTSAGATFAGWSGGGCSGTGTCTVTMTANQNVTASFTQVDGTSTWQGTYTDSFETTPQPITMNITQTGANVSGSWTAQFASNGGGTASGTFTGTFTSGSVMTFVRSQTQTSLGPCPGSFSSTATVNANSISGIYSGSDCLGFHGNGQISLVRQ